MNLFSKFAILAVATLALTAVTAPASAVDVSELEARVTAAETRVSTPAPFATLVLTARPAAEARIYAPAPAPQRTGLSWLLFAGAGALGVGMLNTRSLRDTGNERTKALPAAAGTNYSDPIDTGWENPGRCPEGAELLILLPATPSLVDAKTITLTVQDSANGTDFAAVADLPPIVVTGAGGAGGAAVERQFKLPITCRRHLRLGQSVLTAGGDNTAISSTLGFAF